MCGQTYVPGLSGDPEIDGVATGLWNVCTRLGRGVGSSEKIGGGKERMGVQGRLYLYGRVLAFHLLGVARPRENAGVGVVVRLMRLGLKVVRDCVGRF